MNKSFLSSAALAALALFATPAAHAQGLGGMLNKAKAKVSQATQGSTPSTRSVTEAAQATQDNSGELPHETSDLTVESQQDYARAVMANTRPWLNGQNSGDPDYFYRQLTREDKVPLKFGWDPAAVKYLTDKNLSLWSHLEDIATDLARSLGPGVTQRVPLLKSMSKVKEIRLATTPQKHPARTEYTDPATHGYFLSFNPATGVLTAAMSIPDGVTAVSADTPFTYWIIKNVK